MKFWCLDCKKEVEEFSDEYHKCKDAEHDIDSEHMFTPSNEELGIWYVFLTISGLLGMLDLGFSPSIFRNMSYAIAGTDKLMENGYSTCTKGVNYKLASQIVIQSKKMFLLIAVFSTIFALTVGTIYMSSLVDNLFDNQQVLISWGLFIVAIFINIR